MRNLLGIICLLILSLSANQSEAANECRLKYKYGNSSNQYKYVNQNQTINFTRSDFKWAENVGNNDMRLTLEYVNLLGQTQTEYLYLIRSGPITISLPPIPLIGKKLKKIQCKKYAAVTDTQAYLQQFGGNVSTLISQVSNTATNAIATAADAAKNAFSVSSANTYKNNAQAAITAVSNAFNNAKQATTNNIRTTLSQHFPEVNQAVNASNQYTWALGNSVLNQGEANIRNTLAEVTRIDQKYAVSSTVSNLISINLAKDFPELNRLQNQNCDIQIKPLLDINGGVDVLSNELSKLDRKYQFSKTANKLKHSLIKLPSNDISKLRQLSKAKDCRKNWASLARQVLSDSKTLEKYLRTLKLELVKLKAAQFKGKQAAFFKEIEILLAATDALNTELKAQKRRKDNMDKAEREHDKAYDQIKNDLGPIQDDIEKFPLGELAATAGNLIKQSIIPKWLSDDPERRKVLLSREISAAQAYQRSIEAHEQGKRNVKRKFDALLDQTGVTLISASKLKINLPNASTLFDLMKKPPQLKFLFATGNAAVSCTIDFLKFNIEAITVMVKAIDQYITNVAKVLKDTIPDDVMNALLKLNSAVASLKNKELSRAQINHINSTWNIFKNSLSQLYSVLKSDPTKPSFKNQVQTLFNTILNTNNEMKTEAKQLTSELQQYGISVNQVLEASRHLNKVLSRHNKHALSDVKSLVQKSLAFEVKWDSANKTAQDIVNCTSQYLSLINSAKSTFLSRLQKLIASKVQTVANALPKNLKDKISTIKSDLSGMLTKFNQFNSAAQQAQIAFNAMATSNAAAIAALVPIPKPDAPQKAELVLNKVNILKQKLQALNGNWQVFNSAQQKLSTDLSYLSNQMRALGGGYINDAAKLLSQPFNSNLLTSQIGGVNNVFNKWNSALQTLPSRIAAVATGGMSTQVENQIIQGLALMNAKKSELLTCLNTATNQRNSMGSSQQKIASLNRVMLGINAEVIAVKNSLGALLPPTINILSNLSSTMNQARNLSDKIANIGATASSQFLSDINGLKTQLNASKNCIVNKHNQVKSKKTQLLNLLNN